MLTYVINTSENKTFDSDQLFKLVGYNKICWLNYALNEMEKCAEEICERQTVLGADDFRIAILVDFYGFNRVRNFYGTDGYSPIETGVDLSVYFPFIEAYIIDHLYSNIRKKELVVKERHIFYIQNGKHDNFNVLSNELKQLEYVLEPDEDSITEVISVKTLRSDIRGNRRFRGYCTRYSRYRRYFFGRNECFGIERTVRGVCCGGNHRQFSDDLCLRHSQIRRKRAS